MTGVTPARAGIWTTRDPEIAGEFAHMAATRSGGNAQIYPLLHRADRAAQIELRGDESLRAITATLLDAWECGYDSVLLRNAPSPSGKRGDSLIVKNPAQLRSPQAVFDPARRNSSDLLAGVAGASTAPLFNYGDTADYI